MRLHQVLTGAANVTEDSVAVGHGCVSGYPFTVYGSGYEVVVLDSHFNRVQIISNHDSSISSIVKCIACSNDGKIAVSFGEKVILYQPDKCDTKLAFCWKKTAVLCSQSEVWQLCWDQEGKRLLVGSDSLHVWRQEIYADNSENSDIVRWVCVWHRKLAAPATFIEFSPDGHYFASAAQNDCMVKIWFRSLKVSGLSTNYKFNRQQSGHSSLSEERYNFIYILHPKPIQSFSWRKISKYMPTSCVPNVLLTSCTDNICRLWTETVKYKPSHHDSKAHANVEKTNTSKVKTDSHVSDDRLHHQRYHLVSMFHFHLAGIINPSSDIALLSTIPTSSIFGRCFQLEWLNNKEVQFTTAVELMVSTCVGNKVTRSDDELTNETDPFLLVEDLNNDLDFQDSSIILNHTLEEDEADIDINYDDKFESLPKLDDPLANPVINSSVTKDCVTEGMIHSHKGELNNLLHDWCSASDTLYCIHPVDGSLLIWVVDYLDDYSNAYYRQVQVSFASRIPATFSKADASSLCLTLAYHYTQPIQKAVGHVDNIDSFFLKNASSCLAPENQEKLVTDEKLSVLQVSYLVSVHADGSLNLWLITFADSSSFTSIASITHITRNCGPRFETTQLVCHPTLPLVIGTSRRTKNCLCLSSECDKDNSKFYQNINEIESELILWNTSVVSPLSEFKGVTEMARISSPKTNEFQQLSWIPALFNHSLVSITNDSIELIPDTTCACFVSVGEYGLQLYQVLLDTKHFLSNLSFQGASKHEILSEFIESEQSGSQSACIMKICQLVQSVALKNIMFLKTYSLSAFTNTNTVTKKDCKESFFVVAVSDEEHVGSYLSIWKVSVNFNERYDVALQSPNSVSSDLSPLKPNSLCITHGLSQSLIYQELFVPLHRSTIKFVSSAVDIASSNLNPPSYPVAFNFLTVLNDDQMNFWKIVISKCEEDDECVCVSEVLCLSNVTSIESVLCISCCNTDKIAFVLKTVEKNTSGFRLVIKECTSTGEFVWNNECDIPIYLKDYDDEAIKELSWLSLENGTYILALSISNSVFIYYKTRLHTPINTKYTSNVIAWDILKRINLNSDENALRITTISWSKCGFFMVGVENEIQVYSQWEDLQEIIFRKTKTQELGEVKNDDESPEHGVILTKNSFMEACMAVHVLPQYHPYHLLQLLNLGKMRRVRTILKYLVRCVVGDRALDNAVNTSGRTRARTLTRTYSNLSDYSSLSSSPAEVQIAEPVDAGKEMDMIPPLLLTACIDADKDYGGTNMDSKQICQKSVVIYGTKEAQVLSDHLSKKHLAGLSKEEQTYLIALSDTIASTSFDLEENNIKVIVENSSDICLSSFNVGGGGYANTVATSGNCTNEAFDDCGLRFLLLLRHHAALLKSLSDKNREELQAKGMLPADYCWAFHSDCTEELLALISRMAQNEPTWKELRAHGVGWWVRSNDTLKRMVEKVAKTHFHIKKDPLDCAIFYLAMRKKSLVCALYRSLRDTKMTAFFNNDFTQERWRKAALKNAYALLGKQRFEHAAAFFLLANSLWDAVQVCIDRLNDIQLALIITRLYENGFQPTHSKLLKKLFLQDGMESHENPFLQSMAYWILTDYKNSLDVLLLPIISKQKYLSDHDFDYPAIFNFYKYLSKHPLLKKGRFAKHNMQNENPTSVLNEFDENEKILLQERKLVFRTAYSYMNSGSPDIAFEVLCMMPHEALSEHNCTTDATSTNTSESIENQEDMILTGTISNNLTFSSQKDSFNTFQSNRFAELEDEYTIGISMSDVSGSDTDESITDIVSESSKIASNHSSSDAEYPSKYDNVTVSMKYTCIVLCIIEELKTLPYKCLRDKTRLRTTLNALLRAELELLHQHCDSPVLQQNIHSDILETPLLPDKFSNIKSKRPRASSSSPDISVDDLTLSEKVEHVTLHAEWLKQNQKVLTSLYEHCSMVGNGETDLPAICLELLLLLHEIEDHRVLSAPLHSISAGPSAPPLLLASMNSFALVASPSTYLSSMAQDILQTIVDLPTLPDTENPVTRLADLEKLMFSLSSCIYHSLCGGEDDKLLASIRKGETELIGKQMKDGKLIRLPYTATDIELDVTSLPANWPGVKFFLSILKANQKNGSHSIRLLLCEVAVAIYLSMLVSACSRLSANNLYRFVKNGLTEELWANVFGGGTKIVVPAHDGDVCMNTSKNGDRKDTTRMKWNYRLLGSKNQSPKSPSPDDNQKLVRHELFISPKISLCDYFLNKPKSVSYEYNSDNENEDSDDEDVFSHEYDSEVESEDDNGLDDTIFKRREKKREEKEKLRKKMNEHFDGRCYAWLIMKFALVKVASSNINRFLLIAGLEVSDLPTQSPLLYNATKILIRWEQLIHAQLQSHPTMKDSLVEYSSTVSDNGVIRGGIILQKIKALLDPKNTPFSHLTNKTAPAKRLWHALVEEESLRHIFLHYAFRSINTTLDETDFEVICGKVLHKDLDPVTSFCLNKANKNYIAVSTVHEIIEYDVSTSFDTDIFGLDDLQADMVCEVGDNTTSNGEPSRQRTISAPSVIQRRTCTGIRRMDSHPTLPYYVTGSTDGSVRMWEYIHPDQIVQFRGAGQNERVNKVQFNPLGNKFAVVDDSGYLSIWLIANTHDTAPFWVDKYDLSD